MSDDGPDPSTLPEHEFWARQADMYEAVGMIAMENDNEHVAAENQAIADAIRLNLRCRMRRNEHNHGTNKKGRRVQGRSNAQLEEACSGSTTPSRAGREVT